MRKKIYLITYAIILILLININSLKSQGTLGIISGEVIDAETKLPLPSVKVSVLGTKLGSLTDKKGYFRIKDVPSGNYLIKIEMTGYVSRVLSDVVVSANRNKYINCELSLTTYRLEGLTITDDFFNKIVDSPVSTKTIQSQEIRRSPGSAEDVFRVMQSLPGVSTAGGKSAQLIVRGGSPDENLTLLDNIEIYNPIHFARSGESMGVISVINPTLLKKVDFLTGGFPTKFGDKMSSVFDMTLNEGNKELFNTDINLNLGGFGVTLDGPVSKNSSVIFSLRRGFFDLLTSAMNKPAAPRYYDAAGKYNFNLNDRNKLSLVGFYYIDQIDKAGSTKQDDNFSKYDYMTRDDYGTAVGINWQSIFSENSFLLTTLSFSSNGWKTHLGNSYDKNLKGDDIREDEYQFKSEWTHTFSNLFELKTGGSIKFINSKHDIWSPQDTTKSGQIISATSLQYYPDITEKYYYFLQTTFSPFSNLKLTTGLRYDYFDFNKEGKISPRISGTFALSDKSSLNFAYGNYYQTPGAYQIAIDTLNHYLTSSLATHYIIGFEHIINEDMKFSVELYFKDLKNVLTPNDTNNIISNKGSGYSEGIEFYLQKKFTDGFVGSFSYTYSKSIRKDGDNLPEYLFEYDRPHILNLIFGYEIFSSLQLGVKFQYATGNPYTPYTGIIKKQDGYYIVNGEKNSARYPDYHKIDVRLDKTFNLGKWSINTYLDLWNIYNRANVISYTFTANPDNTVTTNVKEDFGLLPVFGINILF